MVDIGIGLLGIGAGLAIGVSALGTGMAQSSIGAAGMGLMAEKEGKEGQVLLFLAIPETMVILGFVVAYLILTTFKG
ncbi:MAG: ATPase [Candidatus Micrarchaeota archaeon]|nr:ATPase [Candidatus Micrarchaeota archaeon]